MEKKVVLYTDKPENQTLPSQEIRQMLREFFGIDKAMVPLNAQPTAGFESGINWEELAERGVVAVVLYDVNDACAFGISLEAGEMAGLHVYEIFQGDLLELSNLSVAGKKIVLNLQPK